MRSMHFDRFVSLVVMGALAGCGGDRDAAVDGAPTSDASASDGGCERAALEAAIGAKLDAALQDPDIATSQDVTVLLETAGGRRYTYNHGTSTPTTSYESASTSKLVTATVIMNLVEQGMLSLDSKASDLIDFWTDDTVTLQQLLSFTSGYSDEPLCINNPNTTLEACAQNIWTLNEPKNPTPGTEFSYSGSHMQIAGLMAMKAVGATTWGALFDAWKTQTGLFPTAVYDLPSTTNPRLAGGMHWSGEEYLAFLRSLEQGTLLSDASRSALFASQRRIAVVGTSGSPAYDHLMEDWAYGLGNWLECPTATQPDSFDCGEGHRNSSPGAYGSYPFIDFDKGYIGMIAQRGELGEGFKGVLLFRAVQAEIEAWAALTCD